MASLTWHRHIPLTHIYIIDGILDLAIPLTHIYIIDGILDLAIPLTHIYSIDGILDLAQAHQQKVPGIKNPLFDL
jgi:hypothetical protein